jgi:uncharacterized protein YndB with AHSA1/START domain
MKFKIVLLLAAVAVAGVLVIAAAKPDTFRVQRTVSIKAPAEKIFPLVNDFTRWRAWSPYENKDPAMTRRLSGATAGKGAVYEWSGNKEVGRGRMEIADAAAPSRVVLKLDFLEPFEAHNVVQFTMTPRGDATEVSWDMRGPTPYLAKILHVFIDMDRMVGRDFEAGLANLKALAER